MCKWLDISAKESDYSVDDTKDGDSDFDPEEIGKWKRESRFRDGDKGNEVETDLTEFVYKLNEEEHRWAEVTDLEFASQKMEAVQGDQTPKCQVVAMPFLGKGIINSMMNLCHLIASRNRHILITFVITEEWFVFFNFNPNPNNIHLATISNVNPSEIFYDVDFYEATLTKMEEPFERLLDLLEPPRLSIIIHDTYLSWVVGVKN
ncbi:unnamed protein product [Camellia sinensis]